MGIFTGTLVEMYLLFDIQILKFFWPVGAHFSKNKKNVSQVFVV